MSLHAAAARTPIRVLSASLRSPVRSSTQSFRATRPFRTQQVARQIRSMSSSRTVVFTEGAPGAVGPYSQAIKHNGTVYVSGQVPLVPGTKAFNSDDVAEQTVQVLENLSAILKEAGSSLDKVLKTTVLLADMSDFAAVNAVYAKYFTKDPPARACFAVKELPLGAKVEIEAIAALD